MKNLILTLFLLISYKGICQISYFSGTDINKIFYLHGNLCFATERGLYMRGLNDEFTLYKGLHDEVHDVLFYKNNAYILEHREIYLDNSNNNSIKLIDSLGTGIIKSGDILDNYLYVLVLENDESIIFEYELSDNGAIIRRKKYFENGHDLRDLYIDSKKNIWIVCKDGTYLARYKIDKTPKIVAHYSTFCVTEQKDYIYFGGIGKILKYNLKNTEKKIFISKEYECDELKDTRFSHITFSNDDKLIFSSTSHNSWGIIDIPTAKIRIDTLDNLGNDELEDIHTIFFDKRTNNVFIGTEGHGVFQYHLNHAKHEINCSDCNHEIVEDIIQGNQQITHYMNSTRLFTFKCDGINKNKFSLYKGKDVIGKVLFDSDLDGNSSKSIKLDDDYITIRIEPKDTNNLPWKYNINCETESQSPILSCSEKEQKISRNAKNYTQRHLLNMNKKFCFWLNANSVGDRIIIYDGDMKSKDKILFDSKTLHDTSKMGKDKKTIYKIDSDGYIEGVFDEYDTIEKAIQSIISNIITIEIITNGNSTDFRYKLRCID